jgi:hypothetical protein
MDGHRIKQTFRNGLIDAASVVIFMAITYVFAQGFLTLYTAIYNTQKIPTPDVFSAAAFQFSGAISLVYLLLLTRKHQNPSEAKVDQK